MKVLALSLFVAMMSLPALAGGEDFPFICETSEEEEISGFEIVVDSNSNTGYSVRYFSKIGDLAAQFPVRISQTDDRLHYIVKGTKTAPLFIFDRHILAYISKSPRRLSKGGYQVTFKGFKPTFEERLKPIACYSL